MNEQITKKAALELVLREKRALINEIMSEIEEVEDQVNKDTIPVERYDSLTGEQIWDVIKIREIKRKSAEQTEVEAEL